MIVATAGHVDHGKTSLVRALTGVDTDRLAEEKRRGMSIELGFAYLDNARLGFVDVPGHQRFIRNMLAGVACIDLALVVIAADDGPMPQTVEHLAILGLLGVPRAVVALSKIDRVSPARLDEARREVEMLFAAGPYRHAPVFALVATGGAGVDALRRYLAALGEAWAARPAHGNFRLAVDRSFLLPGAGRVVTGAVLSGRLQVGDAVLVSPQGVAARVRSLHVHDRPASEARAGQRCALNLAGEELKRADLERGDWIVAPAAHAPTTRLDVRLELLASEPRPLAQRTPLQLHIGAAVRNAQVLLLDAQSIAPGATGLAQLVLDTPVAALHGDRFILRDPARQCSVAGGSVIDPLAPLRGRSKALRLAQLNAMALASARDALAAWLDADPAGLALARFAQARNLTGPECAAVQTALALVVAGQGDSAWAVSRAHWQGLREGLVAALAQWHAEQPESLGPRQAELAARASGRDVPIVWRAALASLVTDGKVVREGVCLRLPAHRAVLSAADTGLLERVCVRLRAAGSRPPIVGDLAAALGTPRGALLEFLLRTSRLGLLVRIAGNRFFLPATVAALVQLARDAANHDPTGSFDAAAYRDRSGIGRNLTVQVLEFLDREGVTRFDGARRSIAA